MLFTGFMEIFVYKIHVVVISRLLDVQFLTFNSKVLITLQTVMLLHCGDGSNVRCKGKRELLRICS